MVVPFPYTDLRARKQRPGLVLTPSSYNQAHSDVVLAFVTSLRQDPGDPWAVELGPRELQEGRLPKPSWVRVDKLFTLEQALVRKAVARLAPEPLRAVRERIAALLVHSGLAEQVRERRRVPEP